MVALPSLPKDVARFVLACFILFIAISPVWLILFMKGPTTTIIGDESKVVNGPTFDQKIELIKTLLTVFGVWVGTVIAFYYGSENMKTAQQGILRAISPEERMMILKTKDAMLTPVFTVTYETSIRETHFRMSIDGNVAKQKLDKIVVADGDNKPLGILYNWEIMEFLADNPSTDLDETKIESVMLGIKENPWTSVSEVRDNFVEAELDTSLALVKEELEKRKLDYAIVVNEYGVCAGILTMRVILEKSTL